MQDGHCLHRAGAELFESGNGGQQGFTQDPHQPSTATRTFVEGRENSEIRFSTQLWCYTAFHNVWCADFSNATLHQVSTSVRTLSTSTHFDSSGMPIKRCEPSHRSKEDSKDCTQIILAVATRTNAGNHEVSTTMRLTLARPLFEQFPDHTMQPLQGAMTFRILLLDYDD